MFCTTTIYVRALGSHCPIALTLIWWADERRGIVHIFYFSLRIAHCLGLDCRNVVALFFAFGLNRACWFSVNKRDVVGGAGVGRIFATRNIRGKQRYVLAQVPIGWDGARCPVNRRSGIACRKNLPVSFRFSNTFWFLLSDSLESCIRSVACAMIGISQKFFQRWNRLYVGEVSNERRFARQYVQQDFRSRECSQADSGD